MEAIELARYRSDLADLDLCGECKQRAPVNGERCDKCSVRNSERTMQWQRERFENGQCISCGKKHKRGTRLCAGCSRNASERNTKRRVLHSETRRGLRCGRPAGKRRYAKSAEGVTCRFCLRGLN